VPVVLDSLWVESELSGVNDAIESIVYVKGGMLDAGWKDVWIEVSGQVMSCVRTGHGCDED
jgi:hypothetical protein